MASLWAEMPFARSRNARYRLPNHMNRGTGGRRRPRLASAESPMPAHYTGCLLRKRLAVLAVVVSWHASRPSNQSPSPPWLAGARMFELRDGCMRTGQGTHTHTQRPQLSLQASRGSPALKYKPETRNPRPENALPTDLAYQPRPETKS